MYKAVLMMCLFMFVSPSDGTITITGSCAETSNGEKIEVYGSNRTSINCIVTDDCRTPPYFNGLFVGKPANFRVEHTFLNRTIGNVPVAVFMWNPSTSASDIGNLQGFQLKIKPPGGNEFSKFTSCKIFDLRNNTFVPDDHKLEFKVTLIGLKTGKRNAYYASLSALPDDGAQFVSELFSLPDVTATEIEPYKKNQGKSICSTESLVLEITEINYDGRLTAFVIWEPLAMDWTSDLSHEIQSSENRFNLILNFTLAPREFGLRSYDIYLHQNISQKYLKFLSSCTVELNKPVRCEHSENPFNIIGEEAAWATINFRNITRGQYRVQILPNDPDYNICFAYLPSGEKEERECAKTEEWLNVGKGQESTTGQDVKQTQTSTATPNNTYIDPLVGENRQNQSQSLQPWTVLAIVFGAAAVFFVGAFFIYLRQRRSEPGAPLRKRTVYILSAHDHPYHVTALEKLASYLEKSCHCVIYYQNWFAEEIRRHGVFQWIATHMDKADYTIVINSEAAFNIFNGRKDDIKYTAEHNGPETDTVSFALAHVRAKMSNTDFFEKIIMAYFSYTDDRFLLPFNPGLKYKIPEHLPKLLCHIHQLEYDEMHATVKGFPRIGQLKRSTHGRTVLEAVANAAQYQLKYPDWFSELYMKKDNDPIPGTVGEDKEHAAMDSISTMVAYDAIEFKCPLNKTAAHVSTSENTQLIMTPSKIAAYDREEFNTLLDIDRASCFFPPESICTMGTEEVNQHLGHICLESLNPGTKEFPEEDESKQHRCQAKEDCSLKENSEREALIICKEDAFKDPLYYDAPSDFFIAPESIVDSDACTADAEDELVRFNRITITF